MNAVRFMDDENIFDTIVFQKSFFENIENVIELFEIISDKSAFLTAFTNELLWFNPTSFQTIGKWVISSFEKII